MRERYQTLIKQRIAEMQPGSVFVTSDFADIAPTAAINMSLSRLEDSGSIRRNQDGFQSHITAPIQ